MPSLKKLQNIIVDKILGDIQTDHNNDMALVGDHGNTMDGCDQTLIAQRDTSSTPPSTPADAITAAVAVTTNEGAIQWHRIWPRAVNSDDDDAGCDYEVDSTSTAATTTAATDTITADVVTAAGTTAAATAITAAPDTAVTNPSPTCVGGVGGDGTSRTSSSTLTSSTPLPSGTSTSSTTSPSSMRSHVGAASDDLARLGRLANAEHLVFNVRHGFEPDMSIVRSVLLAYKNDRNAARGEFGTREAELVGTHLDDKSYNAAVRLFADVGMPQHAEKLIIDMENIGYLLDPRTLSAVAVAFVQADKADASMELLGRLADRGLYASVAVHNVILLRLATTCQTCRALKWFHNLQTRLATTPDNGYYRNLFHKQAVVTNITTCLDGFETMIDEGRHHPTEAVIKESLRPFAVVAEADGEADGELANSEACNRQADIFSAIFNTMVRTFSETLN